MPPLLWVRLVDGLVVGVNHAVIGLLVAALCAALDLARRPESEGRNILVVLPTGGR